MKKLMLTAEVLTQFCWRITTLKDRANIGEFAVRILPQWLDCTPHTEHPSEGYFKNNGSNNLSTRHSSCTKSSSSINTKTPFRGTSSWIESDSPDFPLFISNSCLKETCKADLRHSGFFYVVFLHWALVQKLRDEMLAGRVLKQLS